MAAVPGSNDRIQPQEIRTEILIWCIRWLETVPTITATWINLPADREKLSGFNYLSSFRIFSPSYFKN